MAIKKQIEMENGIPLSYYRIKDVEFDFANNQMQVLLECYVSEEMRDQEKSEVSAIEDDIEFYHEIRRRIDNLKDGDSPQVATEEELARFYSLDLRELEAKKYTPRSIQTLKYGFEIPSDLQISGDIRDAVYNILTSRVPDFIESEEV